MQMARYSTKSFLTIALIVSVATLMLQLFPTLLSALLAAVDVRNWSWNWSLPVGGATKSFWWGLVATMDVRNWAWTYPVAAMVSSTWWGLVAIVDVRNWAWTYPVAAVVGSAWWGLVAILDVSRWTWRSYAVVQVIALVTFIAIKVRRDNAWDNR